MGKECIGKYHPKKTDWDDFLGCGISIAISPFRREHEEFNRIPARVEISRDAEGMQLFEIAKKALCLIQI